MRKKIVVGNWKMNLTRTASNQLVDDLSPKVKEVELAGNRVIVTPTFVNLSTVVDNPNRDSHIEVASQNMHFAKSGAYTGEIAADMLKDIGIRTVILGHSERREYFNEDDTLLKQKVVAALESDLEVIFCFGEKLEDRTSENHFKVVENQLKNVLFDLASSDWKKIVLAYEPVWAIGTGMTATPEQAQEMHAFIRGLLKDNYNNETAESISILYGGSVKPNNAKEIFSKPDVDGGLIGGASLKADDFLAIIKAM